MKEAIGLVEAGKEMGVQRTESVELPAPLLRVLDEQAPMRAAFESLTPGRQREYARFIAEPKREATRDQRLAKLQPMIQAGHGMNDRYRK